MWLLDAEGNEERLIAVGPVLQPGDDLTSILSILVLFVCQAAGAVPHRRILGEQWSGGCLCDFFPGLSVLGGVD
jgi:hypothetical protein